MSFCAVAFFFLSFFRLILAVRIGAIIQDLCVGLSEVQVTSHVVLAEVVKASWAALPGGGGYKRAPPTDDAAWQTAPTACTAGAALCGEWRDGEKRKGGEQIELDATFWGPGWKVRREK